MSIAIGKIKVANLGVASASEGIKTDAATADLLFDGIANSASTEYSLVRNLNDYQFLLICDGIDYTNNITVSTLLIPTEIIDFANTQQFVISTYANSSCSRYINFYFTDYNTFMIKLIIQKSGVWGQSYISKIYGIK